MAKHDNDDDFGADLTGNKKSDKPSGLLSKLPAPLVAFFSKIRDLSENIMLSVNTAFHDKERPWMPIVMLSGAILVLLMLVIIMFVMLGSAFSGGKPTEQKPIPIVSQSIAPEKSGNAPPLDPSGLGVSGDPALLDTFLGNPILPNEPLFMLQGEIHYQRLPKPFWGTADIEPGWQDLGKLYRVMLREQNSDDFYRMMGEKPPKHDGY